MSPIEANLAALGAWWGYAEADPTIVGLVVLAVVVFAIAFVVQRVRAPRGSRPDPRSRSVTTRGSDAARSQGQEAKSRG